VSICNLAVIFLDSVCAAARAVAAGGFVVATVKCRIDKTLAKGYNPDSSEGQANYGSNTGRVMSAKGGGVKGLETSIGVCLLVILFFIGLGVYWKQMHYDPARFGTDPVAAGVIEGQVGGEAVTAERALSSLAPAGFPVVSEVQRYTAENLYEKIDGKAPFYVESGFERLFTRRFVSDEDESPGMELYVYDMGDVKSAFSVYSVQRRPDAQPLEGVQFGYRTANAFYWMHGRYYMECIGWSESAKLAEAMSDMAGRVNASLGSGQSRIAELDLFPRENLVSGSSKLYSSSAFGFAGLNDVFAANYLVDSEMVTAFFKQCGGEQQARETARSYYDFLLANGGRDKQAGEENLEARVVDFYGMTEIVLPVGVFVAGVHEAAGRQSAERVVQALIRELAGHRQESGQ